LKELIRFKKWLRPKLSKPRKLMGSLMRMMTLKILIVRILRKRRRKRLMNQIARRKEPPKRPRNKQKKLRVK
jgi:hypothetical protein